MFLRIASIALHVFFRAPVTILRNGHLTSNARRVANRRVRRRQSTPRQEAARTVSRTHGISRHRSECATLCAYFSHQPRRRVYFSHDADVISGKHNASFFSPGDERRRAIGISRIDEHLYARQNGWMINALARLYAVTGDASTLAEAERSARWVTTHRSLAGGGFAHRIRLPI